MQTLAFLWFELQPAQQCLRETFSESQIPAKAGMALSFFRRRRIYEPIKNVFGADYRCGHEGVTSIREEVRAGLGVAVLPDWLIREDLLSGQLVRVLPQWNAKDLPVHVVYAGHRLLPTRVRAFIDFAVSYMTKEFGSNA